jgi:DNA-directed RNA polymerase specialized sigma24 family protein
MSHITLLICRWLSSTTEKASDLAFSRYYNAIAPQLMSFLRWKLSGNSAIDAADVFQELICKHLKQLKDIRPDNAARVIALSATLHAMEKSDLIIFGQIATWGGKIRQWVSRAMNIQNCIRSTPTKFPLSKDTKSNEDEDIAILDKELAAITNEFKHLQKDGFRLYLQAQKAEIPHNLDEDGELAFNLKHIELPYQKESLTSQYPDFFEHLLAIAEILDLLPSIRLPSLPLLLSMAKTTAIDAHRASHSQNISLEVGDYDGEESRSLLDSVEFKERLDPLFDFPVPFDSDSEQLLLDCHNLLEQPTRQAERDLGSAASKQEQTRAIQRLKKCSEKFYRNWAVFQLALEDTSECDIAAMLSISRDMVRTSKAEIKTLLQNYA